MLKDGDIDVNPEVCMFTLHICVYALNILARSIKEVSHHAPHPVKIRRSRSADVVWAEKAQADVIESYIKNFHVPPLLLSKFFRNTLGPPIIAFICLYTEKTEDGKFVCMDGKQRLTSIKK